MHIEIKVEKTTYVKVVTFGGYIQVQCYEGPVVVQEAGRGQHQYCGEGVASTAMQSRQINGCVVGNLHHSKQ